MYLCTLTNKNNIMSKTSYILSHNGSPVAVINTESITNLKTKLTRAIKEELIIDEDTQFSVLIGEMGDWGEDTDIKTLYLNDGQLIEDNEFVLMKTVSY